MRIEIRELGRTFGSAPAVEGVSATIEDGEFICILGPSGCGKTTMLNMLGGIIAPTAGTILFDGVDVTKVPAEKRGVGFVFQNYALYPHLTVAKNIEFPLAIERVPRAERRRRVREAADLVQVGPYLDRRPAELSGGQQQRVAIARALVKNPSLLLLDEPLSNLDARLRLEMRVELQRIQREAKVTTVFVTHDQDEAMSISDRTMLMNRGRLVHFADPQELYDDPAELFAATFLGNPPINQLRGRIDDGDLTLADGTIVQGIAPAGLTVDAAIVGVRSETVTLASTAPRARARVEDLQYVGRDVYADVRLGDARLSALVSRREVDRSLVGTEAPIGFDADGVHVFDAESGRRIR